jgi:hypothetical protein
VVTSLQEGSDELLTFFTFPKAQAGDGQRDFALTAPSCVDAGAT